jgi:hypothetical protein
MIGWPNHRCCLCRPHVFVDYPALTQACCYRVVLEQKAEEQTLGQRGGVGRRVMEVFLGIWCMNPAIGFKLFAEKTHSVILASGEHMNSLLL